jgi:hypothetical protein
MSVDDLGAVRTSFEVLDYVRVPVRCPRLGLLGRVGAR